MISTTLRVRSLLCSLGLLGVLGGVPTTVYAASTEVPARFQRDCERRLPPARIIVNAKPSSIEYNFNKNTKSLTAHSIQNGADTGTTLGYAQSAFRINMTWSAPTVLQDAMSQANCLRPVIEIDLSVGPQQVHIAREFPRGTCSFDEIVAHELRHVQANQDQLEAVADMLERELRSSFGNRVFYGSVPDLKRAISETIEYEWMPWAKSQFSLVERAHAKIDAPSEYARFNTICGGEVPKVLGNSERR